VKAFLQILQWRVLRLRPVKPGVKDEHFEGTELEQDGETSAEEVTTALEVADSNGTVLVFFILALSSTIFRASSGAVVSTVLVSSDSEGILCKIGNSEDTDSIVGLT